jgi:hypothetical protein
MLKRQIFAVVVCSLLLLVTGCRGKTTTVITAQGNTVQATQNGQILEWQLLPSSVNVKSFQVEFIGVDPCGTDHPALIGYPGKPVSCKVSADPSNGGYVFYQYNINVTVSGPPGSGEKPDHVISCNACGLMSSYSGSVPNQSAPAVQPSTSLMQASSEGLPSKETGINPVVVLDCVKGSITVTPSNWDSSPVQWYSGSSIQPDWSVTFDASSPCSPNNPPFTSGNNTCTVSAAAGTYKYTVKAGKCSSTPGSGTVTVP